MRNSHTAPTPASSKPAKCTPMTYRCSRIRFPAGRTSMTGPTTRAPAVEEEAQHEECDRRPRRLALRRAQQRHDPADEHEQTHHRHPREVEHLAAEQPAEHLHRAVRVDPERAGLERVDVRVLDATERRPEHEREDQQAAQPDERRSGPVASRCRRTAAARTRPAPTTRDSPSRSGART